MLTYSWTYLVTLKLNRSLMPPGKQFHEAFSPWTSTEDLWFLSSLANLNTAVFFQRCGQSAGTVQSLTKGFPPSGPTPALGPLLQGCWLVLICDNYCFSLIQILMLIINFPISPALLNVNIWKHILLNVIIAVSLLILFCFLQFHSRSTMVRKH